MSRAEQFIKDSTRCCSNEMVFEDGSGAHVYEAWLTPDQARRAVEIAREEMIEKACEWLKEQNEMIGVSFEEDFIVRFKDYIKGE